jgi:hypothetical protein
MLQQLLEFDIVKTGRGISNVTKRRLFLQRPRSDGYLQRTSEVNVIHVVQMGSVKTPHQYL